MAAGWLVAAPPDEIDAERVRLRRWHVEEAEELTRLVASSLEHLRPWMPWAQGPPSVSDQRVFLERMQQAWHERTDFVYAVTLPATGEPVGGIGLHTRQGPGTLEIGYWMAAAHVGRGYTTAGARALTDAAFALPRVERVQIRCDEANLPSAAVPRKLGFKLVFTIRRKSEAPGETGRALVWEVQRGEWPASVPTVPPREGEGAPISSS